MLAAHGLVKQHGGRRALDGFDLTVRTGEITGLIGHNGAGKTTFVEVVTGLVRPDAWRVAVGGVDVRRDPHAARRLLGVAPQEVALYVSGELRISSTDPSADLAALLAAGLAPDSVDVRRPDLDDLYRAVASEAPHAA